MRRERVVERWWRAWPMKGTGCSTISSSRSRKTNRVNSSLFDLPVVHGPDLGVHHLAGFVGPGSSGASSDASTRRDDPEDSRAHQRRRARRRWAGSSSSRRSSRRPCSGPIWEPLHLGVILTTAASGSSGLGRLDQAAPRKGLPMRVKPRGAARGGLRGAPAGVLAATERLAAGARDSVFKGWLVNLGWLGIRSRSSSWSGASNAVNLTDGSTGLAIGPSSWPGRLRGDPYLTGTFGPPTT